MIEPNARHEINEEVRGLRTMNHTDITPVLDAELDDILSRWHYWQDQYRGGARGFNSKSVVAGDFRVSRQWDDQNGALDSDLETETMKSVDFHVSEMVEPYRAAIYVQARALCVGYMVFNNPRLPSDPVQRDKVFAHARTILRERLTDAGIL